MQRTGIWEAGSRIGNNLFHSWQPFSTTSILSLCAPTYHWGGLLMSKAEEAKQRYRAIRSSVNEEDFPNSDKVPVGKIDLQFLIFWIRQNAWDITHRSAKNTPWYQVMSWSQIFIVLKIWIKGTKRWSRSTTPSPISPALQCPWAWLASEFWRNIGWGESQPKYEQVKVSVRSNVAQECRYLPQRWHDS